MVQLGDRPWFVGRHDLLRPGSGDGRDAVAAVGPTRRYLAAGFLATAAALFAALNFAGASVGPFLPKCLFHETTGLYCPGCGGTRAVFALLQGRFGDALHDNVLIVALIPLASWFAWRVAVLAWTGTWIPPRISDRRLTIPIAAIIIAFFVLRNVPVWPLTWLAPLPK